MVNYSFKYLLIFSFIIFTYESCKYFVVTEKLKEKYSCVGFLSGGASGNAYLVEKKVNKERFVLKIVKAKTESAFEFSLLQSIAKENCEGLIKLEDSDSTKNFYFFVLEYGEKGTLWDYYVIQKNNISSKDIFPLAARLIQGLKCLHKLGFAHKDLKLENIVMKGDSPIIIDFDLAVDMNKKYDGRGTPCYFTPKALAKDKVLFNQADDLFELGVTLYSLKFKRHPFPCHDFLTYKSALINGNYKIPLGTEKTFAEFLKYAIRLESSRPESADKVMDKAEEIIQKGIDKLKLEITGLKEIVNIADKLSGIILI